MICFTSEETFGNTPSAKTEYEHNGWSISTSKYRLTLENGKEVWMTVGLPTPDCREETRFSSSTLAFWRQFQFSVIGGGRLKFEKSSGRG